MRILIVDDEENLVEQIRLALTQQKYTVDTAFDGEEALEKIYVEPYDLILLDIMLPKRDGFGVLFELRDEKNSTPVLMLTAKGAIEDKIKGLDMGADDYLAKPFSMEELLARMRALLRRSNELVSPVLEVNTITLDPAKREVHKDGQLIELTLKEFSILEFLMYNINRAISRVSIAEHVWGDEFDPWTMSNSIDVHIKNLRKKIDDSKGQIIRTVRGVGYIIKDDDK
ncbi:CheY-like receiver and winged-helix DNA-binding domain-containing response regulator [Desulfocapsa sulfexigens DSM 10523]|uniref:CheY-like receiver and winged-helix DNA-binding domain-containing response regulator n=1 Tax=Desulfocapsa sulfexigens (strain DSM 10523 / SB164P1) TaxID=1167006 RepID=M1NE24_DESSD|nr:response regulator transcription factor [Desulfocapsa sulfexigens]AGF77949.1 CheY-like receiver and winged-helix DNA-binding domain-containing response regulator [Desulfocapsa sulfexigens DSM 10523]